jgi:hypothetical protein
MCRRGKIRTLVLKVQKLAQVEVHAVEKLKEIAIAKAAIFLRPILADGNELLLTEDLELLRHHRLAASEGFIKLGYGLLAIGQNFNNTQPDGVGHRLKYFGRNISFFLNHASLQNQYIKHYNIFIFNPMKMSGFLRFFLFQFG